MFSELISSTAVEEVFGCVVDKPVVSNLMPDGMEVVPCSPFKCFKLLVLENPLSVVVSSTETFVVFDG